MKYRLIVRGMLTALVLAAFVAAISACSHKRTFASLQGATSTQPREISLTDALTELNALPVPDGVKPEVFKQLKDALNKALRAKGTSKISCTPPTNPVSAIPDLALADHGDGTMDLTWSHYNVGDYNQDGVVSVADITPLAMHFSETYDIETERDSIHAVVDGSANGSVGIEDITQIAMYFGIEVDSYAIEASATAGSGYSLVIERGTSTGIDASTRRMRFSYNFTGVAGNWYRVVPRDSVDEAGIPSNAVLAWATGDVPAAPGGLSATAESSTKISLSWTDNSDNELGFRIGRKEGTGGTWATVTTIAADGTGYEDTGLTPETTYYYRMQAYNADGHSAFSNEANATTSTATAIPRAPANLSAEQLTSAAIQISWTDNSNNESGFEIERKEGAGGIWGPLSILAADTTTFTDTAGLSPSTEYYYRARAFSSEGNSAWCSEARATTFAEGNPPNAPSNLTATVFNHSLIDLLWKDNSSDETGFDIERKTSLHGTWSVLRQVGDGVISSSDLPYEPNTTFYYRVRAVNLCGYSAYSNEASATTSGWIHTWGGSGNEVINGIAVDGDGNVIAAGSTNSFGSSDVLIEKRSPDGELLWRKTWDGDGDDEGHAVDTDSAGNIYVGGISWNGSAMFDTLLLKYAPDGTLSWTKLLTDSSNDKLVTIAVDGSGNIYGASNDIYRPVAFKYSAGGDLLWYKGYYSVYGEIRSICIDSSGNAYLAGCTDSFGAGNYDALVIKLNADGEIAWLTCWGSQDRDEAESIALDSSGNVYVTGSASGLINPEFHKDAFLLKYDSSDGALLSQQAWSGYWDEQGLAIDVDGSGNVYIAGSTSSFPLTYVQLFIVKVLSTGALSWQKTWGGGGLVRANALCIDNGGNVYIGGITPDISGYWNTPGGDFSSVAGTSTFPTDIYAIPAGEEGYISGIEAMPAGVVDTGGGGEDALVMKVDQSEW
jgi:hypothetical protein